ncbi:hypothetical protein BDV98DRAFT_121212 [Pterulicium gracile]|uniref:Uncharacterized protein n=1 Tax=Pterulicium gracile TaxID=1884261 RepID=A0A5C3QDN3_9AGAR|nr:hypothetical protein BDV98DRAFT_121212 [Pterula gracilis]
MYTIHFWHRIRRAPNRHTHSPVLRRRSTYTIRACSDVFAMYSVDLARLKSESKSEQSEPSWHAREDHPRPAAGEVPDLPLLSNQQIEELFTHAELVRAPLEEAAALRPQVEERVLMPLSEADVGSWEDGPVEPMNFAFVDVSSGSYVNLITRSSKGVEGNLKTSAKA